MVIRLLLFQQGQFLRFVLLFVLALIPFEGECREISKDVFRLHILANSDSDADQALKLKVRDAVIEAGNEFYSDVQTKEEAMKITKDNLQYFASVAYDTITANGYDYTVTAAVENVCFNTRYYGDVTMPGGYYDALQIKIGEAKGKNWWCVMYPSLCIGTSSAANFGEKLNSGQYNIVSSKSGYTVRFKVVEIYNSLIEFFRR